MRDSKRVRRRAVSIFEVIICTGLVTLMIVPLSGVIRSSGQSIADASGEGSLEVQMRSGLRYLSNVIRQAEIQQVRPTQLVLRMSSGRTATVNVSGGELAIREGSDTITLAEQVRRVRFVQRTQRSGARLRTGVEIRLIATDPVTRRNVIVTSAVAVPPQV